MRLNAPKSLSSKAFFSKFCQTFCQCFLLAILRYFSLTPFVLVATSVSNGMGQCNFSGQRDRSSFIVPGQRDQLKILPRDGTGLDSLSKSWTGCGTERCEILTDYPIPSHGTKWDRTEKDVLKQEKDVLKQKRMF
jgi:hypothetical protein